MMSPHIPFYDALRSVPQVPGFWEPLPKWP